MKKLALLFLCFLPLAAHAQAINSNYNNVQNYPNAGGGALFSLATPVTTITYSATPALSAVNPLQTITLTGNAAPTITGISAGQRVEFEICQNGTGSFTWTWPSQIHGGATIGSTASTCTIQSFVSFNGTDLVAENVGVVNVAP